MRKQGDKVRITAQLIQAEDGYHLWSETYDGDLKDVFALQERIARAITGQLQVVLAGPAAQPVVKVATTNPEAYALYLQASSIFNRREGPRMGEAIAMLERALALDPGFARAEARLSTMLALAPLYLNMADAPARVDEHARRASELDATLGEPYAARAQSRVRQRKYLEAWPEFERALALDPDDVTANFWHAIYLVGTGYSKAGTAGLDRVLALDPLLPNALFWRGFQYLNAGDLASARRAFSLAQDQRLAFAAAGLGHVELAEGHRDQAMSLLKTGLRALQIDLSEPDAALLARATVGEQQAREAVRALFDRAAAAPDGAVPPVFLRTLLLMGDAERVFSPPARASRATRPPTCRCSGGRAAAPCAATPPSPGTPGRPAWPNCGTCTARRTCAGAWRRATTAASERRHGHPHAGGCLRGAGHPKAHRGRGADPAGQPLWHAGFVNESDLPQRPSAWRALRERKLVQWAAGYAAAAWVVLQVLALVGQQFEWPPAALRAFTIVLGTGLFAVLVLAWFHGERGQQKATPGEIGLLAAVALAGAALVWRFAPAPAAVTGPTVAVAAPAAAPAAAAHSIAVLPFADMSQGKDQEYFSDGISEELLNLLAKIPQLQVTARTSSFSFKGKDVAIPEIARTLHVGHVLEGSVRKSGDKVRITVQLVRAIDGTHLWSETYDRTLDDIFKVQDEIAGRVVEQLQIRLLGAAPKSRTTDPQAYALYLQSTQLYRQATAESLQKSVALSQQALAIDPRYVPAWGALSIGFAEQANFGQLPADEGYARSREAAQQALAIDPDDAPTHAMLGYIASNHDNDFAGAAAHFQRALALDPINPSVLMTSANFLSTLGRFAEAQVVLKANLRRDPVSLNQIFSLGLAQFWALDLDAAIASFRTVLDLSPGRFGAHHQIGTMLILKGDPAGGLAEMQRETYEPLRMAGLPLAYHALAQRSEADAALNALVAGHAKDQHGGSQFLCLLIRRLVLLEQRLRTYDANRVRRRAVLGRLLESRLAERYLSGGGDAAAQLLGLSRAGR